MRASSLTPTALALAAALAGGCAPLQPAASPPAAAATPKPVAQAAAPAAAVSAPGGAPGPARSGATAPGGTAGATPPARPALAPFAEVTRDAKTRPGFIAVWTRDEKTWLEVPAHLLDKPFFLGHSNASGLGEAFLLPGLMSLEQVVKFRRSGNTLQLVAVNLRVRAQPGSALARAVDESYSESLLAAAPLAAAPHAERKSLLVELQALLGGDLTAKQTHLETVFRMPYSLDRANSVLEKVRTDEQGLSVTLRNHFAVPKLPAPPVLSPGAPPPNPAALPNPPRSVPDPRSLFLAQTYTLAPLPAEPMAARAADPRVGFFTSAYVDLADPGASADRRRHIVQRWRLEKKDPAADVSEPKAPVRVVMDRNIPPAWRDTVRAGILEWNKAFERAGFRNALAVEQQPDDADWTVFEGTRLLAVRWFSMSGPGATAVGPSQGDPRTGEILRGAAIIPENWVRFDALANYDQQLRAPAPSALPGEFAPRWMQCTYAADALEQTAFGLDLLSERGQFEPRSPEARRYVEAGLKAVVVHEVGHALGLRHNFKASTGITQAQLRDPAFTAARGVSNSVMDYNATNLPLDGERVADYFHPTLGHYDYWAIEYGYRPFAPDEEAAALERLARQSETDPALAYAPDEDVPAGDPSVNRFDLGDDPLAFAGRQLVLARELWSRVSRRTLDPNDDLTLYRRVLQRGLSRFEQSVPLLTRYVGGVQTLRAHAGAGKPLITPVPAARQREALELLLSQVFASASFRFDPAFMSRLGSDKLDWRTASSDFSLAGAVLGLQRPALDTLMSDSLAARLADAEVKVAEPARLLSYAEVQGRLREAVWAELKTASKSGDIDSLRRNLQREHVKRLAAGLLRPTPTQAADVRSVHRQEALALEAALRAALSGKGWNATTRAHLADAQASLADAMRSMVVRQQP